MRSQWILMGRALWVLLALDSILTFVLTLWIMFQFLQSPSPRLVAGLAEHGLAPEFYAGYFFVSTTILFFIYFIVALLIFLRRSEDSLALFVSIFLLAFGAANAYPQFAEFLQFYQNPPEWYAIPVLISNLFSYPLFAAFFALYPDGQFVPRWMRFIAGYGFFLAGAWGFFPNAFSNSTSGLAFFGAVSVAVIMSTGVYARIWRYRHHSSPLQRQQTKWFTFGLAIFLVVNIVQLFTPFLPQNDAPTSGASILDDLTLTTLALISVVIPLAIGIAILRYRLWDIDVIIRRTLIYGVLTVVIALLYFSSIVALQQIFRQLSGQRSDIAIIISTLGIAALFNPLRRRVQDIIDHRFYRRKYDAQKVLERFAATVRDEVELEKLTGELLNVVNETMQPTSVSLWLKKTDDQRRKTEGNQSRSLVIRHPSESSDNA